MECQPCKKQRSERSGYNNIKKIAEKYATNQGVIVGLFMVEKSFDFMEIDCQDIGRFDIIELVHPVQRPTSS